jgi:hypothetical protein
MRTGAPVNRPATGTDQEQLQTPDKFIADDFESEDIAQAVKDLGSMWKNGSQLSENERIRSLRWHYDFGKSVAKHYAAVKKERAFHGDSMYGDRFFQRVADDINAKSAKKVSAQLLSQCYTLVGTYSEKAFEELCQHDEITPSHALALAYIKITEMRDELQAKLIKERWTVRELDKAHVAKAGPRRKPGAGRPLKTPKHPKGALIHLTAQARGFVKSIDEIWFGDAFDIVAAVGEIPSSELTDELETQISEAVELCDELAETATDKGETLREVLADVTQRHQAQVEHDRQVAEEEGEVACAAAG